MEENSTLLSASTSTPSDLHSILRVNQAGEYGAKRIYQGQLSALRSSSLAPVIQHMASQEEEHLQTFNALCAKRRVRPTILSPFWHVFGYGLGYLSGKLGEKAAMACTVAVEEVIDKHYRDQLSYLQEHYPQRESTLKKTIEKFREEELEHKDIGIEHDAQNMVAYPIFSFTVKTITQMAISLSKRF